MLTLNTAAEFETDFVTVQHIYRFVVQYFQTLTVLLRLYRSSLFLINMLRAGNRKSWSSSLYSGGPGLRSRPGDRLS
jgi:hypothetical protein